MTDSPYTIQQLAEHVVEIRIHDQKRDTLDSMKADFLNWYHTTGGPDRPYVRALFDVSRLFGPSPYAGKIFQDIAVETPYNTKNVRIAAVVRRTSMFSVFNRINPLAEVLRLFHTRDEALKWLNDGLI
jgi:hypothetical protein